MGHEKGGDFICKKVQVLHPVLPKPQSRLLTGLGGCSLVVACFETVLQCAELGTFHTERCTPQAASGN
jgi:hypothetical protein